MTLSVEEYRKWGGKRGGFVFDCRFFCFILFCDAQNGGGGFLHITAGSDVSLGIDSWLDDMSSPSLWLLLA